MKQIILLIITIFGGISILSAQIKTKAKIENVKTEVVDEKIKVDFTITNLSKGENVKVELKFQNGDQFIYPKSITGSTDFITEGNQTILWDVLKDVDQLDGEIKPIVLIVDSKVKLEAPNAFTPGFNSTNKIIATVSYACILTGAFQLYSANSNYKNYQNEIDDPASRSEYYDKAVSAKSKSMILLGTGVGLLATNVLLAKIYKKKHNLASINYKNGAISLCYVYTFH